MTTDTPPERRRTGRPSKTAARTAFVSFRATEAEAAAIMARAAQAGASVSDFARAAALGAPVRHPRPASASGYSPEAVTLLRRLGNNLNQCVRAAHAGDMPPDLADLARETLRDLSAVLRRMLYPEERGR